MESLSVESKLLYDILVSETDEIYEARFAAYSARARVSAAAKASSTTRSAVSLRVLSSAAATDELAASTSSPTSTQAVSTTAPTTAATSASTNRCTSGSGTTSAGSVRCENTKDHLIPEAGGSVAPSSATSDISTMLQVPTELHNVHDAVNIVGAELAASTPTTCSSECPNDDTYAFVSAIISSATPNSTTTTCGIVLELSVPETEVTVKVLNMAVTGDTTPMDAICLPRDANHNTGGENRVSLLLTPWSATSLFNAHTENSPTTISAELMAPAVGDLLEGGDNLTLYLPWPPPEYVIRCNDITQALLLNWFVLECTQLILWVVKILWPPDCPNSIICIQNIPQLNCHGMLLLPRTSLFPLHVEPVEHIRSRIGIQLRCLCSHDVQILIFCFAACRVFNLHGTVDILQISGDWHFLRTVEIGWNATPSVIIFALGDKCVQLQPIASKWLAHRIIFGLLVPVEDTTCDWLLWFCVLKQRPLLWPSFECNQVYNLLWSIYVHEKNSEFLSGDGTKCCPSILDDALLDRISVTLPDSVVKLVLSQRKFRAIHLQFPGPLHEAQAYWSFSNLQIIWFRPLLESGFQFCVAGKASLSRYGAAQLLWKIAWRTTTLAYSIPNGTLMHLIPECSILISYLEIDIKSLAIRFIAVLHLHWDPGGFIRHWLRDKAKNKGVTWLLGGSYLASSEFRTSEIFIIWELSFWRYSISVVNHMMLKVYPSYFAGNYGEVALLNHVLVQLWFLPCFNGHIWKFSWDPGIWSLLCFDEFFTQAAVHGGIMVEAPTYCSCHCIEAFLDQAFFNQDYYINLVQVHSYNIYDISFHYLYDPGKIKESHVPWDPGGLKLHRLGDNIIPDVVTSINMKNIHLPFSHLTWDPGGYICNIGLRASRILRRGDCQRPLPTHYWAGWVGRHLGPWPAWEADAEETGMHICEQSGHTPTWLGTGRKTAASAEAGLGLCCVYVA